MVAGAARLCCGAGHATAFHGAFVVDGFARFAKILILIGAALCILLAEEFFAAEAHVALRIAGADAAGHLGMMLMVSAASFIALYMGLELQIAWRFMCWPPSTAIICAPPKRA